jgi:hypothetical protein
MVPKRCPHLIGDGDQVSEKVIADKAITRQPAYRAGCLRGRDAYSISAVGLIAATERQRDEDVEAAAKWPAPDIRACAPALNLIARPPPEVAIMQAKPLAA